MGGAIFKEDKFTLKTHPYDIVKKYLPLMTTKRGNLLNCLFTISLNGSFTS